MVAATHEWGIGLRGALPWRLPADMAFFKDLTTRCAGAGKAAAVVMGRATWASLPPKFRPLPGRLNVVLSASGAFASDAGAAPRLHSRVRRVSRRVVRPPPAATALPPGVLTCTSLPDALALLASPPHADAVETVFVIGGGKLYASALASPLCEAVHLTRVAVTPPPEVDTFMPPIDGKTFALWSSSEPRGGTPDAPPTHTFLTYVRRGAARPPPLPPAVAWAHGERQYLELARRVMEAGVRRADRTGTGTLSLFGETMRFDLRHTFPLLTTKRVFWRGVAEELLWFVAGSTDANALSAKGIHIWDGNGSRSFLDSRGLGHREEGDLGPVYGFQWRHFGAKYTDFRANYAGQGVDQLASIVEALKTNPSDRRMVLTAWNPAALAEMALPPCHMMAQFYVARGELSCMMVQRSCDMGLGVPCVPPLSPAGSSDDILFSLPHAPPPAFPKPAAGSTSRAIRC